MDGDGEHARDGRAGHGEQEPVGQPAGERVAAREPHEGAVGRAQAFERRLVRAARDELRRRVEDLDELGGQRAAGGRPALRGAAGERGAGGRDDRAADEQPGREDETGRGEGDGRGGRRHRAREQRHERRPDAAEVEVLERVDVGDHARQEVSAPVALELRRARAGRAAPRPAARAPASERSARSWETTRSA